MNNIIGYVVEHPTKKGKYLVTVGPWSWYKPFIKHARIFRSETAAESFCRDKCVVKPITTNSKGNVCLYKKV